MDEEVLQDAVYRGILRAVAVLCFLVAVAGLLLAVPAAFTGSLMAFIPPLLLFAAAWVLRVLSVPRTAETNDERVNQAV